MTARDQSPGTTRTAMVRLGGILAAVLAAVGLVLLPVPSGVRAHAADSDSGSAVTESGTDGPSGDFSKLKVTVEQTENLRDQGIKVTWTGGEKSDTSGGPFGGNFLQIMQCWGDSPDGPDRTQCEFGMLPVVGGAGTSLTSGRTVGQNPTEAGRYDPNETQYPFDGSTHGFVPFTTAGGDTASDFFTLGTYFSAQTTNEQPYNSTGADGSGQSIFRLESGAKSDVLNCGAVATGQTQPEPCWLVVVPRGVHDPDGSVLNPARGLQSSPLAATNWNQRIVFRLDFQPIGSYCPIDQDGLQMSGSESASEALASWQPTLCTEDKTKYTFVQQSEDLARDAVTSPVEGGSGLAFVEKPIETPSGSPPVVHAPTAVSGLVIGYNIEVTGSSVQVPRLRLNARLVAKLLTQSYQCDLPGPNTQVVRGKLPPANPQSLGADPEFRLLNPDFPAQGRCSAGLIVPQSPSDGGAQLWRWLRSDHDAESFLKGQSDPWGMKMNATFLAVGAADADSTLADYPKPDPTTWQPNRDHPELVVNGIGLNPPGGDLHDDAVRTRNANSTAQSGYDPLSTPPKLVGAPQFPGQRFMLGLTDAATAARYRLGTAELLNADGQFVGPTVDAMTKAVNGMKEGNVAGVLDPDPGLKTSGAYPLTAVTYAAASTALDAPSRQGFATLIRFAAGPGQTPGIGLGLLPPGYAPLTPALQEQARTAATQLLAGVPPAADPGGGGDGSGGNGALNLSGGGTGGSGSGGTGPGGSGSGGASGAAATTGASASATPPAGTAGGTGGSTPGSHNVAESGSSTPGIVLGAVRWVLLIVLIAGVAGSLGGPLLMRAGAVRGSGRRFPAFGGGDRKAP